MFESAQLRFEPLNPKYFTKISDAHDFILENVGNELRLCTPLGLGKPNQLLNFLYASAKKNPQLKLRLFTALSLAIPHPKVELERRFITPFLKRHFGEDYPELEYLKDLAKNSVPENITLHEFYFQAGKMLKSPHAQQNYISLNYTHVAQSVFDRNINVVVQLVAKSKKFPGMLSLSCNSDVILDLVDLYRKNNKPILMVAVVHPDLPYLGGDAEVGEDYFQAIVESKEVKHQLFAVPRMPVDAVEHAIGFHASRLVVDDGTLQMGIGALSDAITSALILRHKNNAKYIELAAYADQHFYQGKAAENPLPFTKGLYGTSEMVMDGFMQLRKAGILKREIFDGDEKKSRYLHGAFFLGSKDLYEWLRNLSGADFDGYSMTRVSKVNDLYDEHEYALRRQRKNARFFNTCMKVSLLGTVSSDTYDSGNVVSGVGGQYNFVAMSHELPDSISALMLKSSYDKGVIRQSNVVWSHGFDTIPRHLRDVVITEYGTADLRGKSDSEVIAAVLEITDARFQSKLLAEAKKNGKIASNYQISERARQNTPEKVLAFVKKYKESFPTYPLGSDFTEVEQKVSLALIHLEHASIWKKIGAVVLGLQANRSQFRAELERIQLYDGPILLRLAVLGALSKGQ